MVSEYRLDDRGSMAGQFSYIASALRPALRGPPSLVSNGYRESIPRGKARPERDADHSPYSSAEVKNE